MSDTDTETYESSCCTDCYMFVANGDAPLCDPETGEDFTEEGEAAWVANFQARNEGVYWFPSSWPLPDGEEWSEEDRDRAIDCESQFSWSSCNLCRSSLGGDRYPVAGWKI